MHPKVHHPPPVPSPFPYLPATPQELLRAYLEIVGLRPRTATARRPPSTSARAIQQGGLFTTNIGAKQPCADGTPRMRTHACEHVVFVYRDRPEYVEGRARWDAYLADVLQAQLVRANPRPPVQDDEDLAGIPGLLRPVVRVASFLDRFDPDTWFDSREEIPPQRYCWPLVK